MSHQHDESDRCVKCEESKEIKIAAANKIPTYEVTLTKELCKLLIPSLLFDSSLDDRIRLLRLGARCESTKCENCRAKITFKTSIACPNCEITFYCPKPSCYQHMYMQHVNECLSFPDTSPPNTTLYPIEVVTKAHGVYKIHDINPHSKKVNTRLADKDFNVDANMFMLELK